MRNLLLFLFFTFCTNLLFSQNLSINGDTVVYGDPNFQMANHLVVKNNATFPMNVLCRKTNLSLPDTITQTNFCWAGSCYGASTIVSPNSAPLAAGQSISYPDDTDAHTGYYDAFGVIGIARVEYCFYNEQNPSDMTCVIVRYDGSGTSAAENTRIKNNISNFYPNPSSSYTYFKYDLNQPATLKIVDVLGSVVKEIFLANPGVKTISTDNLNKGVYFANLIIEDKILEVKKLVVNK